VRADQRILAGALRERFPAIQVTSEWAALADEPALYSPRVDIAVGPFAIDTRLEDDYDTLVHVHRAFLGQLHASFEHNVRSFNIDDRIPDLAFTCSLNRNARCFLAIEIEGSGSRKHTMGGAINAAALGRVGVSAACSSAELKKLLKMRRYLRFLASVGKNTFDTTNLLVVTTQQLAEALGADLAGV
jgi:hypothetical protein